MADSDSTPPDPPKPSTKTSTVPLKKETVRITLRARPEETGPVAPKGSTAPVPAKGGTAPVPEPTPAPAPPAAAAPAPTPPPAPVVGGAPAPPPAPSAPPAPLTPAPGAPKPPGAKTIPLAKAPSPAAGAAAPVGAKTIPLAKAPKPAGPAVGKQTTPLGKPGGGGAKPLPQATVKLQQTQPMAKGPATGAAVPATPDIKGTEAEEEDWEEEYEESGLVAFSVVVLLLSLAVLGITLITWNLSQT